MADEDDELSNASATCCLIVIVIIIAIIAWKFYNRGISSRDLRKAFHEDRVKKNYEWNQRMVQQPPAQPLPQYQQFPQQQYSQPPPPPPQQPQAPKERCPSCGTEVDFNWNLCPKCGMTLEGPRY